MTLSAESIRDIEKKNVIHMTYLSARTFSNCLILWNIFLSNIVLQKGYTVKRLRRAFR